MNAIDCPIYPRYQKKPKHLNGEDFTVYFMVYHRHNGLFLCIF